MKRTGFILFLCSCTGESTDDSHSGHSTSSEHSESSEHSDSHPPSHSSTGFFHSAAGSSTGDNQQESGHTGHSIPLDPIELQDGSVSCGNEMPPDNELRGEQKGANEIEVYDDYVAMGCCPDSNFHLAVDDLNRQILVTYQLSNDVCDCICELDGQFRLINVPKGDWTLMTDGPDDDDSLSITIQ